MGSATERRLLLLPVGLEAENTTQLLLESRVAARSSSSDQASSEAERIALTLNDGRAGQVYGIPVVKRAAHDSVFPRFQHDVTPHKLFHRPFTVCHETAQHDLPGTTVRGSKNHDAEVKEVTVHCVRSSKKKKGAGYTD